MCTYNSVVKKLLKNMSHSSAVEKCICKKYKMYKKNCN